MDTYRFLLTDIYAFSNRLSSLHHLTQANTPPSQSVRTCPQCTRNRSDSRTPSCSSLGLSDQLPPLHFFHRKCDIPIPLTTQHFALVTAHSPRLHALSKSHSSTVVLDVNSGHSTHLPFRGIPQLQPFSLTHPPFSTARSTLRLTFRFVESEVCTLFLVK